MAALIASLMRREYLRAINLYRQRVWTCKATGQGGLTYEEALTSEARHAAIQQVWSRHACALWPKADRVMHVTITCYRTNNAPECYPQHACSICGPIPYSLHKVADD